MALRFETEELDDDTIHYLRTVRELEGEGMPGIYLDAGAAGIQNQWLFGCGAIGGVALVFATFIMVVVGSLTDPVNTALLQTAGFLLGGWLVVAWVRVLIGRQRSDYVGHFKFVDPLYVWHGTGRGIWVTPIEGLRSAYVDHNHNNEGNYTGSNVTIRLGDEREVVTLKSMARAEQVTAYLEAVAELRDLSPIDRGYRAKGIADLDEEEMLARVEALVRGEVVHDDDRRGRRRADEHREVDAIPEPHKVRTNVLGWWPYPAMFAVALVTFFTCKGVAGLQRDQAFYNEVKDKRPPDLRAYLVDPRNTRYRPEVQKKLDTFHEQAATRIRNSAGGSPELKNGVADIADGLKKTTTPIVLIGFKGTHQAAPGQEGVFAGERLKTRQRAMSKALAEYLVLVIGDDLALYADAAGGAPPHIEIGYEIKPVAAGAESGYVCKWTVTLRGDPAGGGKAHVFQTEKRATGAFNPNPDQLVQRLHDEFLNEIKANLPRSNPFVAVPGMPRIPAPPAPGLPFK